MAYEMRPLKTKDVYPMSKILKKLDVKLNLDLSRFAGKKATEKEQEEAGKELVLGLIKTALENLHQAEEEVNGLLSSLVGITSEEFNELPIEDTLEIITLFKNQKGLAGFLKLAGK